MWATVTAQRNCVCALRCVAGLPVHWRTPSLPETYCRPAYWTWRLRWGRCRHRPTPRCVGPTPHNACTQRTQTCIQHTHIHPHTHTHARTPRRPYATFTHTVLAPPPPPTLATPNTLIPTRASPSPPPPPRPSSLPPPYRAPFAFLPHLDPPFLPSSLPLRPRCVQRRRRCLASPRT